MDHFIKIAINISIIVTMFCFIAALLYIAVSLLSRKALKEKKQRLSFAERRGSPNAPNFHIDCERLYARIRNADYVGFRLLIIGAISLFFNFVFRYLLNFFPS